MQRIPRCMSTQHPDNVNPPFFAENKELGGEDEIQEAYYAFSHLNCDEQMWDCEGKEVDNFVVKKLLTQYGSFFADRRLGQDLFLTLRVPNPTVEKAEAKILLETLESIPRSFDAASLFYGDDIPPIFEIILPMTASTRCIDRIYRYYSDFVVGKQDKPFRDGDITIGQWIGKFRPERINVIPLFEDMEHMLDAHTMTREYLDDKRVDYQRVFLARSDPAMNYGLAAAVLLNKIALARLHRLSADIGIPIYPIIGVGSSPFRGNLRPPSAERVGQEYPSAHTFTIQSAFKYDYPFAQVRKAIDYLRQRETAPPHDVDEERCLEIIERYAAEYRKQIHGLSKVINSVARFVPSRRKRKLHIGLFGYSRSVSGITLPRAIAFTAALYSIGLPPEILALNALSSSDVEFLSTQFVHFKDDLKEALAFLNPRCDFLPGELEIAVRDFLADITQHEEHRDITDHILSSLKDGRTEQFAENVLRAAHHRGFLG